MKFIYNNKEYELIVLNLAGSKLYGNATPESDTDYRGIYIENTDDKCGILGHTEQLQGIEVCEALINAGLNLEKTEDITIYELNRFVKLAIENNPNIMDTLCHDYTNHNIAIYNNAKGREFLSHKHLFLSKKLKFTFSGYAYSQLKRIKGHNKWINQFPKTDVILNKLKYFYDSNEIDFNWICDNFGGKVAEKITGETPQKNHKLEQCISYEDFKRLSKIDDLDNYRIPRLIDYCVARDLKAKRLNLDEDAVLKDDIGQIVKFKESYHMGAIKLKDFLINNASFRTFSPSMLSIYTNGNGIFSKEGNIKANDPEKIGDFVCLLQINHLEYKKDKDHINKMWNWKCNRNEKRGALEEKFGVDLKHLSHLWRLMVKAKEILITGDYNPELKGEQLQNLIDIRSGKKWGKKSYEEALKFSEQIEKELNEAFKTNNILPEKPDVKKINELILKLQKM